MDDKNNILPTETNESLEHHEFTIKVTEPITPDVRKLVLQATFAYTSKPERGKSFDRHVALSEKFPVKVKTENGTIEITKVEKKEKDFLLYVTFPFNPDEKLPNGNFRAESVGISLRSTTGKDFPYQSGSPIEDTKEYYDYVYQFPLGENEQPKEIVLTASQSSYYENPKEYETETNQPAILSFPIEWKN